MGLYEVMEKCCVFFCRRVMGIFVIIMVELRTVKLFPLGVLIRIKYYLLWRWDRNLTICPKNS